LLREFPIQLGGRFSFYNDDMKASGKPGILAGAAVGAMLTAVLIAVFFAAW
jgi:hypothetical protein